MRLFTSNYDAEQKMYSYFILYSFNQQERAGKKSRIFRLWKQ